MKKSIYFWILFLTAIPACTPFAPAKLGKASTTSPSYIVFATFSAKKMPDNTCNIELIEFRSMEGKIKTNSRSGKQFPVSVTLMDEKQKTLSQFQIDHPLLEDLEFADEQGGLRHIIRSKDTARFYLRFNSRPGTQFIHFESDTSQFPTIKSTIRLAL